MHELAHIWIGASGVSGPLSALAENTIERFCNAVAGQILLPAEAVAEVADLRQADLEVVLERVALIAQRWNVSEGVVTHRLFTGGRITQNMAGQLFRMFREGWHREKQQNKDKEGDSGPSYYTVRRHRLGVALLGVVRRAIQTEAITHTRAAKILGVNPASIDQLIQERIRAA